jgi:hypothetical protein
MYHAYEEFVLCSPLTAKSSNPVVRGPREEGTCPGSAAAAQVAVPPALAVLVPPYESGRISARQQRDKALPGVSSQRSRRLPLHPYARRGGHRRNSLLVQNHYPARSLHFSCPLPTVMHTGQSRQPARTSRDGPEQDPPLPHDGLFPFCVCGSLPWLSQDTMAHLLPILLQSPPLWKCPVPLPWPRALLAKHGHVPFLSLPSP